MIYQVLYCRTIRDEIMCDTKIESLECRRLPFYVSPKQLWLYIKESLFAVKLYVAS